AQARSRARRHRRHAGSLVAAGYKCRAAARARARRGLGLANGRRSILPRARAQCVGTLYVTVAVPFSSHPTSTLADAISKGCSPTDVLIVNECDAASAVTMPKPINVTLKPDTLGLTV